MAVLSRTKNCSGGSQAVSARTATSLLAETLRWIAWEGVVVVVSSKTENFSCGSQAACARTAAALPVTPSARPLLARAQLHGQQSRLSRRLAGWLTGLGQAAG